MRKFGGRKADLSPQFVGKMLLFEHDPFIGKALRF
jgi:hypothetical protein